MKEGIKHIAYLRKDESSSLLQERDGLFLFQPDPKVDVPFKGLHIVGTLCLEETE
jgi:hypothetical protein